MTYLALSNSLALSTISQNKAPKICVGLLETLSRQRATMSNPKISERTVQCLTTISGVGIFLGALLFVNLLS